MPMEVETLFYGKANLMTGQQSEDIKYTISTLVFGTHIFENLMTLCIGYHLDFDCYLYFIQLVIPILEYNRFNFSLNK